MPGRLIAATYARDLTPLAAGGQPVAQSFPQLDAYLRRARSPAHAALFAEPNPDPDSGRTDWYAVVEGEPRRLDELSDALRTEAVATLDALRRDIEAEAAALAQSTRPGEAALGDSLSLALRIPSPEFVRFVGTQPVLFGWGHEQGGQSVTPEALIRLVAVPLRPAAPPVAVPEQAAVPVAAAVAAAPVAATGWRWLIAALLGLLLLMLLLLLLFDPFRWFKVPPIQCLIPRDEVALLDESRRLQRTEEALRNELARLRLEAGARRLACPPPDGPTPPPRRTEAPPPQPPPQPPPPRPQPNPDVARAERERAQSGRMQIILAWDDSNDLDLSVRCPNGVTIAFDNRRGCGGVLDVDRNSPDQARTRTPVENIAWEQEPPAGRYTVYVTHFARQGGPPFSDYRVTLRLSGQPDRTFTGRVGENQRAVVTTFEWPPAGGSAPR